MICRNCQAQVDDDLVFCTNCGARLFESQNASPTVSNQNPNTTKNSVEIPQKSASGLKWAALIVALIAIPASIFGVYLLMNSSAKQPVSQNISKTPTPKSTPTPKKENNNQNANANLETVNPNTANSNSDSNNATPESKTEIMNERIEIASGSHYARSFEVTAETAAIVGTVKIIQGDKIDGLVYLQTEYDDHFPNPDYKIFSFGDEKISEIWQTLVKEKYVIVFVNNSDKPVTVQGKVSLK